MQNDISNIWKKLRKRNPKNGDSFELVYVSGEWMEINERVASYASETIKLKRLPQ
jgi:hypothetical protein